MRLAVCRRANKAFPSGLGSIFPQLTHDSRAGSVLISQEEEPLTAKVAKDSQSSRRKQNRNQDTTRVLSERMPPLRRLDSCLTPNQSERGSADFDQSLRVFGAYYVAVLRMLMVPAVSATREPDGDGRRAEVDEAGEASGVLPLRTA
jgi:hypothetical protein